MSKLRCLKLSSSMSMLSGHKCRKTVRFCVPSRSRCKRVNVAYRDVVRSHPIDPGLLSCQGMTVGRATVMSTRGDNRERGGGKILVLTSLNRRRGGRTTENNEFAPSRFCQRSGRSKSTSFTLYRRLQDTSQRDSLRLQRV